MSELDKIAPALLAAQSEMSLVGKSCTNDYDRYKYANLEDYYHVCRSALQNHGISTVESVLSTESIDGRKTKKGEDQYVTRVSLRLTFLHESGQMLQITSSGEGQDRGDKGTYKAITGARKYAIAMACNLATSDDPEKESCPPSDKDGRPRPASIVGPQPVESSPSNVPEGAFD